MISDGKIDFVDDVREDRRNKLLSYYFSERVVCQDNRVHEMLLLKNL